ncbi:serine/threonine-protein kinase [Umezawaea sp.]|uniref:serine/threonine-protein kinase n=1 Tax=Umezawaea sp. TaxID=1955258 RepID=UPI002ED5DDB3
MSLPTRGELLADRYRLEGLLGTGGMGDVHRAWDTRLRRFVAVKLFRAALDATLVRRFDSEVKTLAALSHPGLVSVYDAGTDGDAPFLVLQLVDGRTLHNRVGDGPLSPDEVRVIGAALADALAYVHAHDVVHRDVKPSNILLDADDNAYLADFGLARLTGATRLTSTGELMGTAAYLAPEQVRGKNLGFPVDVYALGLVLLECLTGYREYEGTEVEAAIARLHRPPDIPGELPADLVRLLTRMTALTPHRRPTALQCARALRNASGTTPPREAGVRRSILVATAAVAAGLVGGAWVLLGDEAPKTSTPTGPEAAASSSAQLPASDPATTGADPRGNTTPGDPVPEDTTSGDSAAGQPPAPGATAAPTTGTTAPVETEPGSPRNNDREPPGQAKKSTPQTKKNGG